jgi:hypothetical protein
VLELLRPRLRDEDMAAVKDVIPFDRLASVLVRALVPDRR